MFDKKKFSVILTEIKNNYNNQEEFAEKSGVGRTYISRYMNCKIDVPPKPKLLKAIAKASKEITTYDELMQICGYIEPTNITNKLDNSTNFLTIPILKAKNKTLYETGSDVMLPFDWDKKHQYFGYYVQDNDMLPILRGWRYCYC